MLSKAPLSLTVCVALALVLAIAGLPVSGSTPGDDDTAERLSALESKIRSLEGIVGMSVADHVGGTVADRLDRMDDRLSSLSKAIERAPSATPQDRGRELDGLVDHVRRQQESLEGRLRDAERAIRDTAQVNRSVDELRRSLDSLHRGIDELERRVSRLERD